MTVWCADFWLAAASDTDDDAVRASRPVPDATRATGPDAELAASIRAGDQVAFESLITQYGHDLLVYLTAALSAQDTAEDVLQELWLRMWRRRETLEPLSGFRAYLFAAARHAVLDHHRAARRARGALTQYGLAEPVHSDTASDVAAALDHEQLRSALLLAVDALPPRMREVWRLFRDEGLSYPEIAERLGVTVGTVKTQMSRAFVALRAVAAPFLAALLIFR